MNTKHIPVLLNEVLNLIEFTNNKKLNIVDATLGGGGHSLSILNRLKNVNLYCIDLDQKSIDQFSKLLVDKENFKFDEDTKCFTKDEKKVFLYRGNFSKIAEILRSLSVSKAEYILADLGWSLDQLEYIQGLSFERGNDYLDMRFDKENNSVTASQILNFGNLKKIKKFFEIYGDLHDQKSNLDKLIKKIENFRLENTFEKVSDLTNLIKSLNFRFKVDLIDFTARVFQSLRIAVNMEIDNLKEFLSSSVNFLQSKGSKLLVITFHSGEQKIVDDFFRLQSKNNSFLVHKIIRPSIDELKNNIRSRSAKLNVIEKL